MKRSYNNPFNYSAVLLSVFDDAGSLLRCDIAWSADTRQDINQLANDQKNLEKDYQNAWEELTKNMEDRK
ncbi:MAG: hypothetical protein NTX49_00530 [Chlamydiae bacterium]|nr:hypothetical protein [Chlamydiota bacterium]